VRWIADLGGYTGKGSGGPPGSVTIGRGFARVTAAAAVMEQLDLDRKQARVERKQTSKSQRKRTEDL
jgi:hypothetical protein